MKTKICLSLLFFCSTHFAFAEETKPKFAEKNTIELGGEVSFFRNMGGNTGNNTEIKANPILSWYFVKSVHVGGAIGLRYNYFANTTPVSETVSIAPTLYLGYTVPIASKIFFDISAFSGIYIYLYDSRLLLKTGFTNEYLWGFIPSLKVDTDNGLITFGLIYSVADSMRNSTGSVIGSVISYSIYF